jgi:hypothetical protein
MGFLQEYVQSRERAGHTLVADAIVGRDGKFYKLYRGNGWKPEEALRT